MRVVIKFLISTVKCKVQVTIKKQVIIWIKDYKNKNCLLCFTNSELWKKNFKFLVPKKINYTWNTAVILWRVITYYFMYPFSLEWFVIYIRNIRFYIEFILFHSLYWLSIYFHSVLSIYKKIDLNFR